MFVPKTQKRIALTLNCVITASLAAFLSVPIQAQSFKIDRSGNGPVPVIEMMSGSSSIRMMSPGSFRNLMRPDYSRRDLKLMFSGLDIDQSQRFVMEILMDEYTNQFNTLIEEFKEVRDRYDWPHNSALGNGLARGFTEDILENLENAQVFELNGADGAHFIGMTTTTIDIAGGDGDGQTGVFISGDAGAAQSQGGIMHEMVIMTTSDDEQGEDNAHIIPPEILEKLQESMRQRIEELIAKQHLLAQAKEKEDEDKKDENKATADEVAQAAQTLSDEKVRLAQSFIDDLALLLSETQINAWPSTDRTIRRVNTIPFGEYAGEKLDLVRFLTDYPVKPVSNQTLDSLLNEYKQQLDVALKTRNDYLSDSEIKNFIAYSEEDNDEILELMQKESDLRIAVRSVNENSAQSVAALFDDVQAADFQEKVKKESYKSLYRLTRTQRLFDKASKIEDLDQTMIEAIETLKQRYLQELEIANDRLTQATHSEQPKRKLRMLEMMAAIKENQGSFTRQPTNKLMEGMQDRNELGKRYTEQLKQILSDEQFETISPKRQFNFSFGDSKVKDSK